MMPLKDIKQALEDKTNEFASTKVSRIQRVTKEIYSTFRDKQDSVIDIIKKSDSTSITIPTHISLDNYFALTIADRRIIENEVTNELGFIMNLCVINRHVFIKIIL
jgi:hypothetical protein